jgi:hypothetical protein
VVKNLVRNEQKPPKAKGKPPQGEEASKTNLRKVTKWSLEKAQRKRFSEVAIEEN